MKEPIWAIIAAKDEEKYISDVIVETKKYVDCVLVVDDGSGDSTGDKAKQAGAEVLRHIINLGKGAAIKTGCEYAISNGAEFIVLLDADGQHEPHEIPKFIHLLQDNDIVFGVRTKRTSMPFILKIGNEFIHLVTLILYGIDLQDTQSGYRAFKAKIFNKIDWQSSDYSVESEIVANVGRKKLKYSQIPISTIYSDKYKGTTIIDGFKIVANLIWWRISRW